MESLSETVWDVVISGTGIQQSLLALALSRSGKKILHIDRNKYYGGNEAAFSLQEAADWVNSKNVSPQTPQSDRSVTSSIRPVSLEERSDEGRLGPSRSYTLTLSPYLIYSQSRLLPALVSSQVHNQLEFQAVGPWWVSTQARTTGQTPDQSTAAKGSDGQPQVLSRLQRIPSSREDVFADDGISVRDKRSMMKFLRSIISDNDTASLNTTPFSDTLATTFNLSNSLQAPLIALSLSHTSAIETTSSLAIPRIQRHMRSIGAFGPGFGAVMPKYGGAAEIAQVACRASAVGGAVYVLGRGLLEVRDPDPSQGLLRLILSDGEEVQARTLAGCAEDFPSGVLDSSQATSESLEHVLHSITIVSSTLEHLFPRTSEYGPVPAGAVVVDFIDSNDNIDNPASIAPVYMILHSTDSGECPPGQCIIYSSILCSDVSQSIKRLECAIDRLLSNSSLPSDNIQPEALWTVTYESIGRRVGSEAGPVQTAHGGKVLVFPARSADLAVDEGMLDGVEDSWRLVGGEGEFLRFEVREQGGGGTDETYLKRKVVEL